MAKNALNRYVWIVDTLRRYGSVSLEKLNGLWRKSAHYDGKALARRTFYSDRQAIADLFNITIDCDPRTYEYYIDKATSPTEDNFSGWLLNTSVVHSALERAADVAKRISLEPVPSARQYLPDLIEALRNNNVVVIDYQPYTRSTPHTNIAINPYFLKIFKQRWYVIGYDREAQRIKTYALDRIVRLRLDDTTFEMPEALTPDEHFRDLFGIESSESAVRKVTLRVGPRDAKYLRALPLHHSQTELVGNGYSLFTYNMKITDDLLRELLSMGPGVAVLSPAELRTAVVSSLRASLSHYTTADGDANG